MQLDTDRLLRRRLYLQRYVTSLHADVRSELAPGDRRLVRALGEFVADADDASLLALNRQRTANPAARAVLGSMREIVAEQRSRTEALVLAEMGELAEREARVVTEAIGETEPPSTRGVASLPVMGATVTAIIAAAFASYSRRLLADVTGAAATGPDALVRIVRGTRSERFRNGLLYWRDERVLRPNVDAVVNGTAGNAATRVFERYRVELIDFRSTLDFRACPECLAAEAAGPYAIGAAPSVPRHPRCRCLHLPHVDGAPLERPYVLDSRSVKDIPKSERAGKIGTTRGTIADFFDRMTRAQRREYMGPNRAALWEAGKIDSVRDLVNSRTLRPLRLDELPEL